MLPRRVVAGRWAAPLRLLKRLCHRSASISPGERPPSAPAASRLTDVEAHSHPLPHVQGPGERAALVRRAKLLAWGGLAWHGIEASIAIGAGVVAGSIALIGFGADSLIEMLAGVILLWRFAGSRGESAEAEHPAHRLIAVTFWAIAVYVGLEAVRTLASGDHPEVSYVGIGLSVVTLATMPPLAIAKARVAERLHSVATRSEGRQTMLCAYLSAALLVGLGANAAFGWWWADPVAALVIAAVAANEGRESWRGEGGADCC
jgi:divalent metal cation (Fe/Co/Zn/Cd) transporter